MNSLHESLKNLYSPNKDDQERIIEGYRVDVVQGNRLIEIQLGHFTYLRRKLSVLLDKYPCLVVYPLPLQKWILYLPKESNQPIHRRKSPQLGSVEFIFRELIRIPKLIVHPNFSLEVLFVYEEEVRRHDGRGSWRRKGVSLEDRRLLKVIRSELFTSPNDYKRLLPAGLPIRFTSSELALRMQLPLSLTRKMTYCMRHMGVLNIVGKRGNAFIYSVSRE